MILDEIKSLIKDFEECLIKDSRFKNDYKFKSQVKTIYECNKKQNQIFLPIPIGYAYNGTEGKKIVPEPIIREVEKRVPYEVIREVEVNKPCPACKDVVDKPCPACKDVVDKPCPACKDVVDKPPKIVYIDKPCPTCKDVVDKPLIVDKPYIVDKLPEIVSIPGKDGFDKPTEISTVLVNKPCPDCKCPNPIIQEVIKPCPACNCPDCKSKIYEEANLENTKDINKAVEEDRIKIQNLTGEESQLTDVQFTELQNTTEEEDRNKLLTLASPKQRLAYFNNPEKKFKFNEKYMRFLENIPNKEFAMQLLEMAEGNN